MAASIGACRSRPLKVGSSTGAASPGQVTSYVCRRVGCRTGHECHRAGRLPQDRSGQRPGGWSSCSKPETATEDDQTGLGRVAHESLRRCGFLGHRGHLHRRVSLLPLGEQVRQDLAHLGAHSTRTHSIRTYPISGETGPDPKHTRPPAARRTAPPPRTRTPARPDGATGGRLPPEPACGPPRPVSTPAGPRRVAHHCVTRGPVPWSRGRRRSGGPARVVRRHTSARRRSGRPGRCQAILRAGQYPRPGRPRDDRPCARGPRRRHSGPRRTSPPSRPGVQGRAPARTAGRRGPIGSGSRAERPRRQPSPRPARRSPNCPLRPRSPDCAPRTASGRSLQGRGPDVCRARPGATLAAGPAQHEPDPAVGAGRPRDS